MKKRIVAVSCLALFLVTGVNASRARSDLKAPVCRFIDFYVAAEKSEMTLVERVLYGLAVAVKKSDRQQCAARNASEPHSI